MNTKKPVLFMLMAFSSIAFVLSGCYTALMPPPEMRSWSEYENEEYEDAGDVHFYNYGHHYQPHYLRHSYYDPFGYWGPYGYYDPYYSPFRFGINFGFLYDPFLYSSYSYYRPFGFYGRQGYGYSGFLGYPYYIGGYYPDYVSAFNVQKKREFTKRGSYTGSRVVTRRSGSGLGIGSAGSMVLSKSGTARKAGGESGTNKRSVTRSTSKNGNSSVSNNSRASRTKRVTQSRSSSSRSSRSSAGRSVTRRSTSRSSSKGNRSSGKRTVTRKSAKRNSNHYSNISYNRQPDKSVQGRNSSPGLVGINRTVKRIGHVSRPSISPSAGRSPVGRSKVISRRVVRK